MEKIHPTPYDEMMQTRELQMLKTVIPYISGMQQTQISLLIQCLELRRSMQLMQNNSPELSACEIPEGTDRRSALLNELRVFCTPKEQETIDMMLNIFCIMDNQSL